MRGASICAASCASRHKTACSSLRALTDTHFIKDLSVLLEIAPCRNLAMTQRVLC